MRQRSALPLRDGHPFHPQRGPLPSLGHVEEEFSVLVGIGLVGPPQAFFRIFLVVAVRWL
jgi:hypothetical protein